MPDRALNGCITGCSNPPVRPPHKRFQPQEDCMRFCLINPPWTFDSSIYFGCREPHLPLEYGYSKALLERPGPRCQSWVLTWPFWVSAKKCCRNWPAIGQQSIQSRAWNLRQDSLERLGRYEGRISRQLVQYEKELGRLQAARAAGTRGCQP